MTEYTIVINFTAFITIKADNSDKAEEVSENYEMKDFTEVNRYTKDIIIDDKK